MDRVLKFLIVGMLPVALVVACGGGGNESATSNDGGPQQGGSGAKVTRPASADQILTALVVVDAVDSAGFHDMAKSLAEATSVNPRYASTVGNVIAALAKGIYASDVQPAVTKLSSDLRTLQTALQKEDLEGARTAVEEVHDSAHDLGEGVYAWLAGQAGKLGSDSEDVVLGSMAANDLIEAAAFHDMAKDLAQATEINARYAGKVGNVLIAARAATWPDAVKAENTTFVTDLQALKKALDAGNLEGARTAAEAVHDSQHEMSEVFIAWLGKQSQLTHAAGITHLNLCSLKVNDIIASAGFHDMAKDLTEATEINPRYEGKVAKVLAAMHVMRWSDRDSVAASGLVAQVQKLHDALAAGDLNAARAAVEAVHDDQHDFSEGMYAHMMGGS